MDGITAQVTRTRGGTWKGCIRLSGEIEWLVVLDTWRDTYDATRRHVDRLHVDNMTDAAFTRHLMNRAMQRRG